MFGEDPMSYPQDGGTQCIYTDLPSQISVVVNERGDTYDNYTSQLAAVHDELDWTGADDTVGDQSYMWLNPEGTRSQLVVLHNGYIVDVSVLLDDPETQARAIARHVMAQL
jgi:hypothetical protein